MISSRCDDPFPSTGGVALSQIRRELKREIETTTLFGETIYEVWINEETPPQGGRWDSWEVCVEAVKDCDILLVLGNGNAGWATDQEDIGICHAELATALATAPGKVRLISLGNIKADRTAGRRNARFQEYLAQQSLFRGGRVNTIEELKQRARQALLDATVALAQVGVRETSRGKYYSGEALNWQRLDLSAREAKMKEVLSRVLMGRARSRSGDADEVILRIADHDFVHRHARHAGARFCSSGKGDGRPAASERFQKSCAPHKGSRRPGSLNRLSEDFHRDPSNSNPGLR